MTRALTLLLFFLGACLIASCSNLGNSGLSVPGTNNNNNSNGGGNGNTAVDGMLVQPGMVLQFDAAKATGTTFPGTGCSTTAWTDISGAGHPGTLNNFSSCPGGSGWNGSGIPSDPYRLNFFASQNTSVGLSPGGGSVPLPNGNGPAFTVQAWVATTSNGKIQTIAYWGTNVNNNGNAAMGVYLDINTNGLLESDLYGVQGPSSAVGVADGQWHNVAVTYPGGANNVTLYVDGTASTVPTNGAPSPCYYSGGCQQPHPTGNTGLIGSEFMSILNFNGAIAHLMIYNAQLTGAQISANCAALAHRFAGAVCH